jgi:hypothetical protein
MKNTILMKKSFLIIALLAIISATAFVSCNKDKTGYLFALHLTDAPADYEEVNVDIREVRLKLEDTANWHYINTIPGVYNLLGLQNGIDTLIASGIVPSNYIKEIRLYLGDNNTVKVAGQTYPLELNSGDAEKLMIKVNRRMRESVDSLIIDFDAGLSIVENGNGTYRLSPVITVK